MGMSPSKRLGDVGIPVKVYFADDRCRDPTLVTEPTLSRGNGTGTLGGRISRVTAG